MTMRSTGKAATIALLFLIGACIRLEDIRRSETVRTLAFAGSYEEMVECIEYRLRGKSSRDPFRKEISVYNSVKAYTNRGVSHYAMIITQTGEGGGIVERRKLREGDLDQAMVARFWSPVEDCAREAGEQALPEQSAGLITGSTASLASMQTGALCGGSSAPRNCPSRRKRISMTERV